MSYGEGSSTTSSRGSGTRPPGPIPPRWLRCPRKSTELIAGKFLAFKTPLDSKYDDQVPPEFRFSPRMLFDSMKGYRARIGLWVDLCNTSRWYDRRQVENNGEDCKYVKVQCRGHDEAPSQEQVNLFVNICRRFISSHPLEVIAVHCTHGFNRTGFLICSYLVEAESWSPEAAVIAFAGAREPGIYKGDYLEELFTRYGDVSDAPAEPDRPDWCNEEDGDDDVRSSRKVDDDGHDLEGDHRHNQRPRGHHHRGGGGHQVKFVEGVQGVSQVTEQPLLREVQDKMQNMCGARKKGFAGAQPVSMTRDNIHLLKEKPYKVSWKADGNRYLMLIDGRDRVFLADRDNCIFRVHNLSFPDRKAPEAVLSDTLVDGEMVIDEVQDERIPRFLIYDIVKFKGINVGDGKFSMRLFCIEKEIIMTRAKLIDEGKIRRESEPFRVRQKQFWDIRVTRSLFTEQFTKKCLGHEPDGLIFQPVEEPYRAGRDDNILKWKPSSHNSVDFKLKIVREEKLGMLPKTAGYLFVGGCSTPVDEIKLTKELKGLDNKIIECTYDLKVKGWVFMRVRTDKSLPNSHSTAMSVCKSIQEPVTRDMLLDYIQNHRFGADDAVSATPSDFKSPPPTKRSRKV